jgi:hypothetical protein
LKVETIQSSIFACTYFNMHISFVTLALGQHSFQARCYRIGSKRKQRMKNIILKDFAHKWRFLLTLGNRLSKWLWFVIGQNTSCRNSFRVISCLLHIRNLLQLTIPPLLSLGSKYHTARKLE